MLNKVLIVFFLLSSFTLLAQNGVNTSFEQFISLRSVGSPSISPDGQHIAFTVSGTDWKENQYDTEIWISKQGEKPFQLTRTEKGSSNTIKWSPDNKWIAFLADRGNKTQVYAINIQGGEAEQITREADAINNFEWSIDGSKIAFTLPEKESKSEKTQKERFGDYAEDDSEYRLSHLWWIDFKPNMFPSPNELPCYDNKNDSSKIDVKSDCIKYPIAQRLTEGAFTISNFMFSPDGNKIAFTHQPNPLINSSIKSDISLLDLSNKQIVSVIKNPSGDNFATWSPDSKSFLYYSNLSDTVTHFYKNNRLFRYDLNTKSSVDVATKFDENIANISWTPQGLFMIASQKTKRHIFKIDLASDLTQIISNSNDFISSMSFSKNGNKLSFSAQSPSTITEIYHTELLNFRPIALTEMNKQISNWNTGTAEVISWKSKDGAEIEGVLHKPKNFDPKKKYPLLIMIHGGPTGIDVPSPIAGSVYPVVQWVEKGALVLRPNYRGSAGYGEKFRSLNVQNLGVGDAWDVLSGVDHLIKTGSIDTNKMGCMGWSQGGYISAFLTTNTNRFKAISVGAGISNWLTYYVNTDIHPFTRQYLKATPWQDMEIYKKTSPMTNINKAKTPTLIQHGEFDRRVPIANAYELHQGLQDIGVPSKLIVYKGFGHGITKPKERLAALWHNWIWFGKYIWGEELEMPK